MELVLRWEFIVKITINGYRFNDTAGTVSISNLNGSNHIYAPESKQSYYIASPQEYGSNYIFVEYNQLSFGSGGSRAFCPMVSLKSTEDSGYEIVWDTNTYKFQAKTGN